jgi:hypothetical protein
VLGAGEALGIAVPDTVSSSSLKNGALKMGRLKMAGVNAGPRAARKAVNT